MENYEIDLVSMGNRIKELRRSLHYTQETFSSKIHISTSYLALLETGKRTASIDVLAQISKQYHVSIDFLLFGNECPTQAQNNRIFQDLCANFSEADISSALSLAEFYLKNLSASSLSSPSRR